MKMHGKDGDDKEENFLDVENGVSHVVAFSNIFNSLCVFCEVSAVDEGIAFVTDTHCVF